MVKVIAFFLFVALILAERTFHEFSHWALVITVVELSRGCRKCPKKIGPSTGWRCVSSSSPSSDISFWFSCGMFPYLQAIDWWSTFGCLRRTNRFISEYQTTARWWQEGLRFITHEATAPPLDGNCDSWHLLRWDCLQLCWCSDVPSDSVKN